MKNLNDFTLKKTICAKINLTWEKRVNHHINCIFLLLKIYQKITNKVYFLAALSSSRRVVVCWSVGLSVRPSADVCENVTFRVSKGS